MSPQPTCGISILILSPLLCLGLPVVSLPRISTPNPCMHFSCTPQVLHAPPIILLDLITRIILEDDNRSYSSLLRNLLHYLVTSSLLGPNIFTKHPVLGQPVPTFLPQCERPIFTPIRNRSQNCSCVYLDLYTGRFTMFSAITNIYNQKTK